MFRSFIPTLFYACEILGKNHPLTHAASAAQHNIIKWQLGLRALKKQYKIW